jgi:hypothetical protein
MEFREEIKTELQNLGQNLTMYILTHEGPPQHVDVHVDNIISIFEK